MGEGRVEHIFIAPLKAAPVKACQRVEAIAGLGLEGDRYCDPRMRDPGEETQVTLIEVEHIEAFVRSTGLAMRPDGPRRNLVTRGVALNDLVGKRFRVGEALLEGVELCEPCAVFARNTHRQAVKAFVHKGGLRASIVEGGGIRVGDAILRLDAPLR